MLSMKYIKQLCLMILLGIAAVNSHAADTTAPDSSIPYYSWYEVTLPESSGASCGNGTPMRFYINRAQSDSTLIGFEGGGACSDYGTCSGDATGVEQRVNAVNPNGIPHNYMNSTVTQSLYYTFMSPVMTRVDLLTTLLNDPKVETQNWTQVFIPYCSGDFHSGDAVQSYIGPNGNWRVQHFAGLKNTQAVMQWLVSHGFAKPQRLLVWGLSAGGYGSLVNYGTVRDALQPQAHSSLLTDAGGMFVTPFNADPAAHPSVRMYQVIRQQWNWGGAAGLLTTLRNKLGQAFDTNNVGSVYQALSEKYPHDRLGYSTFQQDKTIAAYHYFLFDPAIEALPDVASKSAASLVLFNQELPGIKTALNRLTNFGYYMPWARGDFIDNHTLTSVTFDGTGIDENGIHANVGDFVNNLLNQKDPLDTPVMKAFRTDQSSDFSWTSVAAIFLNLFGINPI
ncbi:pectinacetylesterase [Paraburkholderia acidicola]|uniref:Pectinacetylesterase n=1 Tax=Paraburkholderia acidicola TaxID=1912599 RepID=A0A2A4EY19_9BURK|nr:pectin acetylesterase-family hydrolase [Paraburkholderia acidicola]PCE25320.1 pectinacetylesterase [Paraburkholderia acidicola]